MRPIGPVLVLLIGIAACADRESEGEAGRAPAASSNVQPAPPLSGTTDDGDPFTLESLRGKPGVLVFTRGAFCGLCRRRMRELQTHEDAFDRFDAEIVVVTPDSPDLAKRTADTLDLDYPIVHVDRATFARWGVWPPDERFPRPASFVLDTAGGIRFAHTGVTAADQATVTTLLFELEQIASHNPAIAGR